MKSSMLLREANEQENEFKSFLLSKGITYTYDVISKVLTDLWLAVIFFGTTFIMLSVMIKKDANYVIGFEVFTVMIAQTLLMESNTYFMAKFIKN